MTSIMTALSRSGKIRIRTERRIRPPHCRSLRSRYAHCSRKNYRNKDGGFRDYTTVVTVNKKALSVIASQPHSHLRRPVPDCNGGKSTQALSTVTTRASLRARRVRNLYTTSAAGSSQTTNCSGGRTATNYEITYVPGTVTVSKKALTATASSHTLTYGDAVPVVTVANYTGFINGDNESVISGQSCSTTYTTTSAAGSSQTTSCSGGTATNYQITYVPGSRSRGVRKPDALRHLATLSLTVMQYRLWTVSNYTGFINGRNTKASLRARRVRRLTRRQVPAGSSQTTNCSGGTATNFRDQHTFGNCHGWRRSR